MAVHYRTDAPVTAEQLAGLFTSSGIRRPTDDLGRIQRMIDGASLTVTAWDDGRLVGVARALSDFSYCCYLSDLAVDREYQHQGIGREMIRRVRAEAGDEAMLLLLSAPEAMDYYPKIGMEAVSNGWIIKRAR